MRNIFLVLFLMILASACKPGAGTSAGGTDAQPGTHTDTQLWSMTVTGAVNSTNFAVVAFIDDDLDTNTPTLADGDADLTVGEIHTYTIIGRDLKKLYIDRVGLGTLQVSFQEILSSGEVGQQIAVQVDSTHNGRYMFFDTDLGGWQ